MSWPSNFKLKQLQNLVSTLVDGLAAATASRSSYHVRMSPAPLSECHCSVLWSRHPVEGRQGGKPLPCRNFVLNRMDVPPCRPRCPRGRRHLSAAALTVRGPCGPGGGPVLEFFKTQADKFEQTPSAKLSGHSENLDDARLMGLVIKSTVHD